MFHAGTTHLNFSKKSLFFLFWAKNGGGIKICVFYLERTHLNLSKKSLFGGGGALEKNGFGGDLSDRRADNWHTPSPLEVLSASLSRNCWCRCLGGERQIFLKHYLIKVLTISGNFKNFSKKITHPGVYRKPFLM